MFLKKIVELFFKACIKQMHTVPRWMSCTNCINTLNYRERSRKGTKILFLTLMVRARPEMSKKKDSTEILGSIRMLANLFNNNMNIILVAKRLVPSGKLEIEKNDKHQLNNAKINSSAVNTHESNVCELKVSFTCSPYDCLE